MQLICTIPFSMIERNGGTLIFDSPRLTLPVRSKDVIFIHEFNQRLLRTESNTLTAEVFDLLCSYAPDFLMQRTAELPYPQVMFPQDRYGPDNLSAGTRLQIHQRYLITALSNQRRKISLEGGHNFIF